MRSYSLFWNGQEKDENLIVMSSLTESEFTKAVEQYKKENIADCPKDAEDYNVDELMEWLNLGGDPAAKLLDPIDIYF